jgi:hypothetical protein
VTLRYLEEFAKTVLEQKNRVLSANKMRSPSLLFSPFLPGWQAGFIKNALLPYFFAGLLNTKNSLSTHFLANNLTLNYSKIQESIKSTMT